MTHGKILVLEDELLIAMLFKDILDSSGCTVIGPFARVNTALEAARNVPLDAALLDIAVDQDALAFHPGGAFEKLRVQTDDSEGDAFTVEAEIYLDSLYQDAAVRTIASPYFPLR